MIRDNTEITTRARASLKGRWWWAVGGCGLYLLITVGISWLPMEQIGTTAISLLLAGPFSVGLASFGLALQARGEAPMARIFEGFDGASRFAVALGAYVIVLIFVLFWSLLLIVPGIIAALSYSMTFWLLAEERDLGPMRALSRSRVLMYGHRWQLFKLYLRFIGWYLLCILTLGIGFFWVFAYQTVSVAEFYKQLQEEGREVASA